MSDDLEQDGDVNLPDFNAESEDYSTDADSDSGGASGPKHATDLEAVFDVPVKICAILGRTSLEISDLLELDDGDVIELDRKVGEAIDVYVNDRLIARGEVVLVDEKLGITMTEIITPNKDHS